MLLVRPHSIDQMKGLIDVNMYCIIHSVMKGEETVERIIVEESRNRRKQLTNIQAVIFSKTTKPQKVVC